jgi:hypothetical protein
VVYVVPNGSNDLNSDTNGQIEAWVKEGNAWLNGKIGRGFQFDTFQRLTDVTFLPSKYQVSELCLKNCKTLSLLNDEYAAQNPNFDNSKTLLFMLSDKLDADSCGWAESVSNLALVHNFGDTRSGCNRPTSKATTGLSDPAWTVIHELIHTFGIGHVCIDNSDLMIGRPECTIDYNTYGHAPMTIDASRNQYIGSDLVSGIDLLRMPIWSDGSGLKSYAEIKQISDKKYLPLLKDDIVYAVIGKQSGKFAWDWEKKFYPDKAGVKCQFSSGLVTIIGTLTESACVFDVPNSLRAGRAFTVTQSWVKGPWYGEASVIGTLAREDFTTTPCATFTCFVGGSGMPHIACWDKNSKSMNLQQLVQGKWTNIAKPPLITGPICGNEFKYPDITLDYPKEGQYIFRWYLNDSKFADTPFAVIVNDENSAEPSKDEIASAQTNAIDLGRAADVAEQAAAKVVSAKKTTIACIKGKLTKKVTAVKPKCPAGYKKK